MKNAKTAKLNSLKGAAAATLKRRGTKRVAGAAPVIAGITPAPADAPKKVRADAETRAAIATGRRDAWAGNRITATRSQIGNRAAHSFGKTPFSWAQFCTRIRESTSKEEIAAIEARKPGATLEKTITGLRNHLTHLLETGVLTVDTTSGLYVCVNEGKTTYADVQAHREAAKGKGKKKLVVSVS